MRSLNFHQTFPPAFEHIGRLLELADKGITLDKYEISDATGIPTGKSTGKVEPHIDYAIMMGLLKDLPKEKQKYTLEKTELGREILLQDMGINEEVSQLLSHIHLTSKVTGAFLWWNIVRDILPRYRGDVLNTVFSDELLKRYDKPVNTGPFFSSYKNSFTSFKLINQENDRLRSFSLRYNPDLRYVYAYALLYEWECLYEFRNEISSIELEELKFSTIFAWNNESEFEALQVIADLGIIRLNRQLVPYTITRLRKSNEIIPLLYSLLL